MLYMHSRNTLSTHLVPLHHTAIKCEVCVEVSPNGLQYMVGVHRWFLYLVFVFLLGAICTREALRYDFLIAEKVKSFHRQFQSVISQGFTHTHTGVPLNVVTFLSD